jgi:hypothetical protein
VTAEIWIRPRTVVNTDPQRRCYNGCNYSERIDLGEWHLFQTWDTVEFAELVAKGLRCERQEVEVRECTKMT